MVGDRMVNIRKASSTSIISTTTISQLTLIERNLNVSYGITHKVICAGIGNIYEFRNSDELAHQLTPTISSNINGYDNIIDFNDSTYNYTASAEVSASEDIIVYDLGEVKDIIINVKTGVWEYNANSIDLMVSDDGNTWTTLWQNISPANATNVYQWKSTIIKTSARYVKLYYNDSSGTSNNYAVATLEIYDISLAVQNIALTIDNPVQSLELQTHNNPVQIIIDCNDNFNYSVIEIDPTTVIEIDVEQL